jgi:hypothetical protein
MNRLTWGNRAGSENPPASASFPDRSSSTSGSQLVSDIERLLRQPGCPACRNVVEAERSFFSWFEIESFSSPEVQAQLRAGLGMCPSHSRRLFENLGESHVMTIVLREALAGARARVRGETQPGSCTACHAAASGSRRGVQLVMEGLLDPAMVRLYSDHEGMCLGHVLQAVPGAERPTLKVVVERLLQSLYEGFGRTVLGVLAGVDDDARRRALWRERLPELPMQGSTLDRVRDVLEIDACPVCLSSGIAEQDYLHWFLARSVEGDESLRSDPGELRPAHLHDISLADRSTAANQAIDRKRATRIAHLERLLARLSQLPALSRRGRRNSGDGLGQICGELLAAQYCPACNARDGIARSRHDLLEASLALGPMRERYERGHGLCARHAMQLSEDPAGRFVKRHLDARLAMLAWEVGEVARKYAWAYRHETSGPECDAWLRALGQIDGRVFEGGPAPAAAPTPERQDR